MENFVFGQKRKTVIYKASKFYNYLENGQQVNREPLKS